MADVLAAVAEANAASPGYSHVPARLVRLLHPSQEAPLPRTAKGSIVRREVEARYGPWLEAQLAQVGANGAYGQGEEEEEEGAMATRIDEAQDSLGLAVLFGRGKGGAGRGASVTPSSAAGAPDGGRGSNGGATDADERAADVVVQHAKVFLLFAVLLRHLQRFSLKTCHAWDLIPPENTLVCVSNNMLQARATPPPPHGSAVPASPASRPHPRRHAAHAHAHAHARTCAGGRGGGPLVSVGRRDGGASPWRLRRRRTVCAARPVPRPLPPDNRVGAGRRSRHWHRPPLVYSDGRHRPSPLLRSAEAAMDVAAQRRPACHRLAAPRRGGRRLRRRMAQVVCPLLLSQGRPPQRRQRRKRRWWRGRRRWRGPQ